MTTQSEDILARARHAYSEKGLRYVLIQGTIRTFRKICAGDIDTLLVCFDQLAKASLYSLSYSIGNTSRKRTNYGDLGFFVKLYPKTGKYWYDNWGSRAWEYRYIEETLTEIGIKDKVVVDVGIGLPQHSNFYQFYIKSGCYLTAFDPDIRLKAITPLSNRCKIIRRSAEDIPLEDRSVDVVVAISAFEHFPFNVFHKAIKELHRVLRDDGHLVATLDLTHDHKKSARWAILAKTMNGLLLQENDFPLPPDSKPLTLESFLDLVSPYFYAKHPEIINGDRQATDLVYSREENSCPAYLHLYKR